MSFVTRRFVEIAHALNSWASAVNPGKRTVYRAPSSASHGRWHSLLRCRGSPSQTAMAKPPGEMGHENPPWGYSVLVLLKAHVKRWEKKLLPL